METWEAQIALVEDEIADLEKLLELDPQTIVVDLERVVTIYQALEQRMQARVVEVHDAILAQFSLMSATFISRQGKNRLWFISQRVMRLSTAVRCGIRHTPDPSFILDE